MKSKPLRICVQHLSVFSCTVTLHLSVVGCDSIRRSRKKDSKNNYYFKREKFCQELNLAGGGASKLNQRKNSTKSAKLITHTKFQRKRYHTHDTWMWMRVYSPYTTTPNFLNNFVALQLDTLIKTKRICHKQNIGKLK